MHPQHITFYRRQLHLAVGIILLSLALGVLGYHLTENMPWIDALLNASMILGGMGPVSELHSVEGKLFASFYALYSCFLALGFVTVLMAPVMHRTLKRFHDHSEKN